MNPEVNKPLSSIVAYCIQGSEASKENMASINSAEVIFYSKRKDISRKVELIKGRF